METHATRSAGAAKRGKLATAAARALGNPTQLRVFLLTTIFAVWYLALYAPTTARIDENVDRAAKERKRLEVALGVERLRAQVARFEGRLPTHTDPNEWVQYMMNGVRGFELRLVNFDTDGFKDFGAYRAIVLKLEVEGGFREVDEFLRWVEGNRRLFRVDQLKLEPSRGGPEKLDAQLVLLGVMG